MVKRKIQYAVTHSYVSDPDQRKVEAALELWQGALAERVMAEALGGDTPIVRLHFPTNPRRAKRKLRCAENT